MDAATTRKLQACLAELQSHYSSNQVKEAIETLLKIHRNILYNKNDPKYRMLKLSNQAFGKKVWSLEQAASFMIGCGWTNNGTCLQFHKDELLTDIINILLQHRFVFPSASEWREENKVENLHTSEQREEQLRKQAAIEREKELQELKKEKEYREQLAKYVKQQIADDRREFNRKFPKLTMRIEDPKKLPNTNNQNPLKLCSTSTLRPTSNVNPCTLRNTSNVNPRTLRNTSNVNPPTLLNTSNVNPHTLFNTSNVNPHTLLNTSNVNPCTLRNTSNVNPHTLRNSRTQNPCTFCTGCYRCSHHIFNLD